MASRLRSLLLAPVVALLFAACSAPHPGTEADRPLPLAAALGAADPGGFAQALAPRPFVFPADHGPHSRFRSEWWYLTGNLETPQGRRFGFQVTFFRFALDPEPPVRRSRWATNQIWMAHLALSDVQAGAHRAAERFARGALGLAGARAEPFEVWLDDWRLAETANDGHWQLRAAADDFALDLRLVPVKLPLPQGDHGLSRKGDTPGNASYYYSIPRLTAAGTVTGGGEKYAVDGLAWLDREWSTSSLGPDLSGWDWFALQLADGTDIMYYRLRRSDGSAAPLSRGSSVQPDGTRRDLLPGDVELTPRRWWQDTDGHRYPVAWEFHVGPLHKRLLIRPVLDDQLMALSVRYWEGAVDLIDPTTQATVGRGYLELAGY